MVEKVADLRPSTSGHDLVVKVVKAATVVERPKLTVVEAIVGDDSATIVLSAKNEHAELVKPGACLKLTNAKVDMYRGSMRLAVDGSGKLEAADASVGGKLKPKEDYNMSLIEFELVPVS